MRKLTRHLSRAPPFLSLCTPPCLPCCSARGFLGIVQGFKDRLAWHGQSAESNPSGGNNYRGLYNIGLKSLGAWRRGGSVGGQLRDSNGSPCAYRRLLVRPPLGSVLPSRTGAAKKKHAEVRLDGVLPYGLQCGPETPRGYYMMDR
jgi:hypothetical protein